jgi:hypothetical protein
MFTNGEADIVTWKRTDNPQAYMSAAQSLLNMEVGTTGLTKKRRGTKSVFNSTDQTDPNSQMYEFLDDEGNYYIIVSDDLQFHIFQIQSDGSLILYATVVTPYLSSNLLNIDYSLGGDSLILTHPSYPVARLYISTYTPITFTYQVLQIFPLPAYDFGDINYNTASVTAIGAPTGIVGSTMQLRFNIDFGGLAAAQAWVGGQIVAAGTDVNSPVGYYIIDTVTTAGTGTIDFTGIVRVAINVPVSNRGDQYSVRKPAFLAGADTFNRGYPAKVMFYQNRLWLAATPTLSTTLFGSKINQPINFDVGTGFDTDAIIYTIGQTNTGPIVWLNGGKQLEIFTENFEFVCPQDVNVGITPGTFSVRQQSTNGSSLNLKPTTYVNDSYYVNKTGKSIVNFHFDGVGLAYKSSNVSAVSQHLVKNPYNRALQRGEQDSQDNSLYFINGDNTITSFQFSHEQGLAALTPIIFQSDEDGNQIIDLIDITSVDNVVYILKYYTLTAQYFIEKFDREQFIDGWDLFAMDPTGTVTGLSRFEGYKVQVVFENQDFGQYIVSGGIITVFNPNEYSGVVQVGLLYSNNVRPMYIFAGENGSNYFKNISKIYIDYYNSLVFYVNGFLVPYQNIQEIQQGLPLVPKTDTAVIEPVNGWDRFQTFSIEQNAPFDLQILGIAYQIDAKVI